MHSWQSWLNFNYAVLKYWSRKWAGEDWPELIAFLTLYLKKNWIKFSKIPDTEERIKFLQTWMRNNSKWSNSEFRKSIRVNDFPEQFDFSEAYDEGEILRKAEHGPENIKDWINDLHRNFSPEEVRKIILIRTHYLTLQTHEKALYDLYFTGGLSIRGIAKKLNLPMSAVHNMLVDLKNKIKTKCGI